jgi:hypothetical protein
VPAELNARAVSADCLRRWPRQAWQLWRKMWVRLSLGAFVCGLLLQALDPFLGLVALFLLAPSVLWALVVTARPDLGADGRGQSGPLPGWIPGAIRAVPLGLLVGSVSGVALFGAALLAAVALVVAGHPPGSVHVSAAPSALLPWPLLAVWKACGWGAMLIVFGTISLAYVGVFGLYVGATRRTSVHAARVDGLRVWKMNEPALRATCEAIGWRGRAAAVAGAALLLVALLSEAVDPLALVLATFVPCLLAVAYAGVFLNEAQDAAQTSAPAFEDIGRGSLG